jgi:hypothetical protein
MLELAKEQAAALAELDVRRFGEGVRGDLCQSDPKLADDATLSSRLWKAFAAARGLGIERDEIWLHSFASRRTRPVFTTSQRYARG